MNQGTQGYCLPKKTEGRKSRETVPLIISGAPTVKTIPRTAIAKPSQVLVLLWLYHAANITIS
jgi:hypothetical protein